MSARLRRQELRRAATHLRENSENAVPQKSSVVVRSSNPKAHSRDAFSVITHADGTTVQSTDIGIPSKDVYARLENDYISSLSTRKQEKALLTQQMFDHVWDVLHAPESCSVGTAQFRWWVRKMFVLAYSAPEGSEGDLKPVVMHEDRPVVVKDQIYDVLSYCHLLSNHGGRDRTTAVVREHYSWVPKELVARFVKACPTCTFKRTGSVELPFPSDCTNTLNSGNASYPSSTGSAVTVSRTLKWATHRTTDSVSPAKKASSVTLPSIRMLFPHYVSSQSPEPLSPHRHAVGWLNSLTSQPGPNDTPPRSFGSYGKPSVPFDVSPGDDGTLIKDEDQGVLAIDPALLSEDANSGYTSQSPRRTTLPTLRSYGYIPPLGRFTHETSKHDG
ncbi:hypothetical protein EUX98_g4205 [Antrodiella citrinella]|uniref:Integrase zinc-binding domain-containing protein n=1 Tax=Antrodiella citrinella TaxID=2447956 RepID=A0A4S4MUM0_9APHY|nr:hypothetical protein EUX98_g4205 [Antrodiella citrinella]